MSARRGMMGRLLAVFSSLGLSCVLLLLLGLLTWLGTLEQVEHGLYQVQKKYFESFFLVHQAGPVPIPLPGANLVMTLLFVNLLVGGVVRMRRGKGRLGILVVHLGVALMLVAGFVKWSGSEDGYLTLYEDESAAHFQNHYKWELAVTRSRGGGELEEHRIAAEHFDRAAPGSTALLDSEHLPFRVEVTRYIENSRPLPVGPNSHPVTPIVEGVFLQPEPRAAKEERNIPGAYVRALDGEGSVLAEGVLWGFDQSPWTVEVGGERYGIDLRQERYGMPFALTLDRFTKEDHPRSGMPKSFESDVRVAKAGVERPVRISMNEPLREDGLVIYQVSWGPQEVANVDRFYSTFAVVRNPADAWPLYSCIMIGLGLALHFSRKLGKHLRTEARRA